MYIRVAANGDLSLAEEDNMRAFSIRRERADVSLERLLEIATAAGDDHYWLDADAVQELSPRKHDQQWVGDYRAMLAGVAPYGYYDETTNRVKAHVEDATD